MDPTLDRLSPSDYVLYSFLFMVNNRMAIPGRFWALASLVSVVFLFPHETGVVMPGNGRKTVGKRPKNSEKTARSKCGTRFVSMKGPGRKMSTNAYK